MERASLLWPVIKELIRVNAPRQRAASTLRHELSTHVDRRDVYFV